MRIAMIAVYAILLCACNTVNKNILVENESYQCQVYCQVQKEVSEE